MDVLFVPVLTVIRLVTALFYWLVLIGSFINWLTVMRIVNPYQVLIQNIGEVYYLMTHPFYKRIRRVVPMIGTIDTAPLILLLVLFFCQSFIERLLLRLA